MTKAVLCCCRKLCVECIEKKMGLGFQLSHSKDKIVTDSLKYLCSKFIALFVCPSDSKLLISLPWSFLPPQNSKHSVFLSDLKINNCKTYFHNTNFICISDSDQFSLLGNENKCNWSFTESYTRDIQWLYYNECNHNCQRPHIPNWNVVTFCKIT